MPECIERGRFIRLPSFIMIGRIFTTNTQSTDSSTRLKIGRRVFPNCHTMFDHPTFSRTQFPMKNFRLSTYFMQYLQALYYGHCIPISNFLLHLAPNTALIYLVHSLNYSFIDIQKHCRMNRYSTIVEAMHHKPQVKKKFQKIFENMRNTKDTR